MREENRRTDEAARADDNLRPVAQEDECRLDDPDREHTGKSQQGHKRTRAGEGAGADKVDGIPLLGHHPRLQLVAMAHVEEFSVCPRLPNFVGNGQGRVHVATRAAAGEQVLHFNKIVSAIRRAPPAICSRSDRFINVSNLI